MVWNWGWDCRIRKLLLGWETFGRWLVRGRETRAQRGFLAVEVVWNWGRAFKFQNWPWKGA